MSTYWKETLKESNPTVKEIQDLCDQHLTESQHKNENAARHLCGLELGYMSN